MVKNKSKSQSVNFEAIPQPGFIINVKYLVVDFKLHLKFTEKNF